MREPTRHVALVGPMGVGKSTYGDALAEAMGRVHADCDVDLLTATGSTAAGHADAHGLAALHDVEGSVMLARLAEKEGLVISAAASVVESDACREELARSALTVWVDAPPLEAAARAQRGAHRRPLDRDQVLALDRRRRDLYDSVSDVRVASGTPFDEVVELVARLLA